MGPPEGEISASLTYGGKCSTTEIARTILAHDESQAGPSMPSCALRSADALKQALRTFNWYV